MNQIIIVNQNNKSRKRFFKIQFVVSVFMLVILFFYYLKKWKQENEMAQISQVINKAFEIETVYEVKKALVSEENSQNKYFGKIIIPRINLEYSVFNECDDQLLKILPCKFYGVNIAEKGNICIAGHNYNDDRFFGNLDKLKNGDTVYLSDLNGKNYKYIVYDKYKVAADDFSCLSANKIYDLTLLTCDNINNKRLVVKASL